MKKRKKEFYFEFPLFPLGLEPHYCILLGNSSTEYRPQSNNSNQNICRFVIIVLLPWRAPSVWFPFFGENGSNYSTASVAFRPEL